MNVYEWNEDGRLVECGKVKSMYTFWISAVKGDWEIFDQETAGFTEKDKIDRIVNIVKDRTPPLMKPFKSSVPQELLDEIDKKWGKGGWGYGAI